ncbi:MAG: 2Fe-2S iron-sulfur cluster binding domain-containing protein [Gallionellaceae bacterium]|jgi:ferredoxin-NADP reductase/ferredoxin|nr:2Fe-2S iron-sulfur cluster binding domain-containing protein [Gallionellaceae bacterium]
MPKITYEGKAYECGEGSVLDCLTSQGIPVPFSCRSGTCQTCMMRAVSGTVPERAQAGLKDTLAAQHYFLACVCHPENDLEVTLAGDALKVEAEVTSVELLCKDILGVRLKPQKPFAYRAGQFIHFYRDATTVRNYSLATVPELDDDLCLHVRRVPNGVVSGWMFDHLKAGDAVTISEAAGNCFYTSGKPEQDILLVGTGSGLAPLYGIIRDALHQGHRGGIHLYHGSVTADGLYLYQALRKLAQDHANFSYVPCISGEDALPEGAQRGMVLDIALQDHAKLNGWRVFLCGHPEMVKTGQKKTFFAGASMSEIYVDAFT